MLRLRHCEKFASRSAKAVTFGATFVVQIPTGSGVVVRKLERLKRKAVKEAHWTAETLMLAAQGADALLPKHIFRSLTIPSPRVGGRDASQPLRKSDESTQNELIEQATSL